MPLQSSGERRVGWRHSVDQFERAEAADELEHHSRPGERPDLLDLVTDSLRRSPAKDLAIDQSEPDEIGDGADVGW